MSIAVNSLATDEQAGGATHSEWRRAASRALHPSSRTIDDDALSVIAAGLAQVTVPWELRPGQAASERHYERVLSTVAYDAWVIYWPTGVKLDLHDHGGSSGALSVVAGELDETTVVSEQLQVRRLAVGDTVHFGPHHVHAVSNPGPVPATSVHVYSPPISSMAFFAADESGGLQTVREDHGSWDMKAP